LKTEQKYINKEIKHSLQLRIQFMLKSDLIQTFNKQFVGAHKSYKLVVGNLRKRTSELKNRNDRNKKSY
jgi:hypothetical protein